MEKSVTKRRDLGAWGEQHAADYLTCQGYAILGRNVHSSYGEIDLIAQHQGVVVFVEVKTRASTRFGYPEDALVETRFASASVARARLRRR